VGREGEVGLATRLAGRRIEGNSAAEICGGVITHLDYLYHLTLLYCTITINVIHRECPVEFVAHFS